MPVKTTPLLSDDDLHFFNEGSHLNLYDRLGAHLGQGPDGTAGVHFAVWAPDAQYASVVGDFNGWDRGVHPMSAVGSSGVWAVFIPGVVKGAHYKFHIASKHALYRADKADPFAFLAEAPPKTASVVWDLDYEWGDADWMRKRKRANSLDGPMSVYEVHLGSWMRVPEENGRSLTYREMAPRLAAYASQQGFTHVELMPVMEHPFYGSWGYQTTGYFSPTSRYGTPQDFMFLVDTLHRAGVGVILDWVPSHFPTDEHGPGFFDGTHLYEHADPRQGFHPDWGSFIFNYSRNEVRSFLYSSALFWIEKYHADGLRVDAVASMLYLDYSRKEGEWIPNVHGGRENIDAIEFLRRLNTEVYARHPDVQMIAEESTAWGGVSRPTYTGGLGFGLKWDMGWMHDTLEYVKKEPVHRRWHHNELTFRMIYAFHENFMLPLSHDEVVHGKGSILGRMPGDDWQKFANLRALYSYQWAQPGKKLLFMGGEFGQWDEWNHEKSLDWHLLGAAPHQGVKRLVADLNKVYRQEAALHQLDCDAAGFQWIDANDADNSAVSFLRLGKGGREAVLCVFNMTPVPRHDYRLGAPWGGRWTEIFNSDAQAYGGSGVGNGGGVEADGVPFHGRDCSLNLILPPLGAIFLKSRRP
ncbi:MAG: 1,4-alpha-glucan branching protein GlgB [Elusimicrobia bacterium]|nr:1,4-alpha-glucan branching protein GlgB [Elusimicrobiota bacterium]